MRSLIKTEIRYIVLTMVITAIVLLIKFNKLIFHLNDYLFEMGIDPYKSYYNFAYLLKHPDGLRHPGINYPYGDHLHYINSHPIYLYVLRMLEPVLDLSNYGVGIINGGMLLSIVLATPIIYLLLREFNLPRYYAVTCAVIIQFLFPQFARINGHFEMVIAFVFPLYLLLFIYYLKGQKPLLYAILLMLTSILSGMLSAYFAAFCALFTLGYVLIDLFQHRHNWRAHVMSNLWVLIIAILPLLIIKGFVDLSDWVVDRPKNPGGFYDYNANPLSIYLPPTSIIREILPARMLDYAAEGRAYVGLPGTFLTLAILVTAIIQFIRNRKIDLSYYFSNERLNHLLAASVLVLLFSMCWPFEWGLQFIPDNIKIIKQFRALGRFSWVFYYVYSLYTAYFIYHLYKDMQSRQLNIPALLFLIFVLFQWSMDAAVNLRWSNFDRIKTNRMLNVNNDSYSKILEEGNIHVDDYQAVLSLPFAQTNGDKMLFHKGEWAIKVAMAISYHSGLPLIQSFSPRLSLSQGLSSIQLLADPCIEKVRLQDMNDKPILLIVTNQNLRPAEKRFILFAEKEFENKDLTLYTLSPEAIRSATQSCQQSYQEIVKEMPTNAKVWSPDSTARWVYEGFEDKSTTTPITFTGSSAYFEKKGEYNIYQINLGEAGLSGQVEWSFWSHYNPAFVNVTNGFIDEVNEKGDVVKSHFINMREQHNIYKDWMRGSIQLQVKPGVEYRLRLHGKELVVDDILIRSIDQSIIVRQAQFNLFNNYPMPEEN